MKPYSIDLFLATVLTVTNQVIGSTAYRVTSYFKYQSDICNCCRVSFDLLDPKAIEMKLPGIN